MEQFHLARGAVRFGVFEADLHAGELRKAGVKIKLQKQPFQILQMLLEHPGEVITREQLQKAIWPPDTFVDFEQGLHSAIKRLREAVGDSADTPRFIETVPGRGYRFIGTIGSGAGRIKSLAVLPLENLSRDPEQEYFAEGLTEALITILAKIGALRVVPRTSAMQYKGVRKPVREIARELDVDTVVEGTVWRVGDRVRITAQLIDAPNEAHLWAESYDRDLRDILGLQSELAQAIAREIQIKLTPNDKAHFQKVHPVDPEAYENYLRGRYYFNKRGGDMLQKGIQAFQLAITRDPTYVAAYAGMADCLSLFGWFAFVSPEEGCGRAKRLALRALEMDPSLAEAHASLAWAVQHYDYDLLGAEREFRRCIELDPLYEPAHYWLAIDLAAMGRFEEAIEEAKHAVGLDPLSRAANTNLGYVYWCARRYNEMVEQCKKTLELHPENVQLRLAAPQWRPHAVMSPGSQAQAPNANGQGHPSNPSVDAGIAHPLDSSRLSLPSPPPALLAPCTLTCCDWRRPSCPPKGIRPDC